MYDEEHKDLILVVDSTCDLPEDYCLAHKGHLTVIPMGLSDNNHTYGANPSVYETAFRQILNLGLDVFYLGMSSELSSTYAYGEMVARELQDEYPKQIVTAYDSRCISLGYGLLVMYIIDTIEAGASIYDALLWADYWCERVRHVFTVGETATLKRGGRLAQDEPQLDSSLTGVYPIMRFGYDKHGKKRLFVDHKVRAKRRFIAAICHEIASDLARPQDTIIVACGEDNAGFALDVAQALRNKLPDATVICGWNWQISDVVRAHTGPDVLAIFYRAKE